MFHHTPQTLIIRYLAVPAAVLAVISCAPMSNENAKVASAATIGAAGAVIGGIIGNQKGKAAEGAAIGGVLGAIGGYQNQNNQFAGDGSVQKVRRGD